MTQYKAETLGQIVSPCTAQELSDWLRGDSDDPIYSGLLITATGMVINYLQRDLLARDWILTYQDWPYGGTMLIPSLSGSLAHYQNRIDLPYTNLISVSGVQVYGEITTDYEIINLTPGQLCFDHLQGHYSNCTDPALVVSYRAGFGESVSDIPGDIKQAILMIAGYLYSNRGCASGDALSKSGADIALNPYRTRAGIVL